MGRRGVAYDVRGIENRNGEGTRPDPEHLEDPKSKKSEEVVTHRVETRVGAGFEDAEEEER